MAVTLAIGKTIRNAIVQDCIDAWSVTKVHVGPPETEQTTLPYAVVWLQDVPMEWQTVKGVEQTYRFNVYGRFARPVAGNVEDEKITKADSLLAQLMAGATYSGAYLPTVELVTFGDLDAAEPDAFEIGVVFSVRVNDQL